VETFLLVLAALFPVVNPPGAALVFLSLTKRASAETRRMLARRVAINAFFVMAASLPIGALILNVFGISIPVLRVAGGLIVAVAGWKLLNEGSPKTDDEISSKGRKTDYAHQAFYPLTLPLTTGPGTIAVMISLGLSRSAYSDFREDLQFFIASLLATIVIALTIYVCFAYSDRVERMLGRGGTDIVVRLTAFILFCLGVQIIWTGASELLATIASQRA
jgi:multiple antibiotic resistance protein